MPSEIAIDKTGRVVIPAELRRRLGLSAGSRLLLREKDGVLFLEPVPDEPVLVEEGGLIVAAGRLTGPPADHRSVRDERADRLGGLG